MEQDTFLDWLFPALYRSLRYCFPSVCSPNVLKKNHITQTIVCRLIVSVLQTNRVFNSTGFCYCLQLQIISESGAFSKHPKEATLWRELRKKNFSPSGAVRDKNPLWAWAVIFVTSEHARPDVRNFLTSANGCFQSPSFPYHVTKKRRALGTRMDPQELASHAGVLRFFVLIRKV